jgi:DNA polymerase III alpha subunit
MTAVQFVHLHVHSDYSPMRGVSPLEELCLSAQRQGSPAMALTDTNGLSSRQNNRVSGRFLALS